MARLLRWLRWKKALPEEIHFWRDWLETKGAQWPEDYERRLDPRGELQSNLKACLSSHEGREVAILDVGSGPMTRLGFVWEGREVQLTAVDALAHQYNSLLAHFQILPPLRTETCSGEALTKRFRAESFDLAHCRNVLDHCHSPLKVIREMLHVVKPGGWVVLEHYANEAELTSYEGLHQWNFDIRGERLMIWNRNGEIDVATAVADLAETSWERKQIGRPWVHAILRKRAAPRY